MSVPTLKAGARGPQKTKTSKSVSDKNQTVVTVEGLYTDLKSADPADYVPSGLTLENSRLEPSGGGMGVLTLSCILYDAYDASNLAPVRTTFEVGMEEVQYDLEDHPRFSDVDRNLILMWLATDETKRFNGSAFTYQDKDGRLVEIESGDPAEDFCIAYYAGITTFVRYYPVITKKSIWKNPPGLTRSGRSFTGGSLPFSADCGKYDAPPIELQGYPSTNWFHGPMTWVQNENKTWTQTESWTYTPEGSNGQNAWIYNELGGSSE